MNSSAAEEKNRTFLQLLLSVLITLLFVFLICYLGVTYWRAEQRQAELRKDLNTYTERLEFVRRRKRRIAEKNQLLKNNERAVEYLLREKYGLLEPNEYRIIEDERSNH
jgi:cell division protein FtsB